MQTAHSLLSLPRPVDYIEQVSTRRRRCSRLRCRARLGGNEFSVPCVSTTIWPLSNSFTSPFCPVYAADLGDTAAYHPIQSTGAPTSTRADTNGSEGDRGQQHVGSLQGRCEQDNGTPHYYSILGRTSVDIIKSAGYKISALQVLFAIELLLV